MHQMPINRSFSPARNEARELAMEFALKHENATRIACLLKDRGLVGLLDLFELESIVIEAESIQQILPERPRITLTRMIGLIAVAIGVAGIWLVKGDLSLSRDSPIGYGIAAVILGIILILKPSSAKTNV
jgi:uncharacterized protein YjeT (DUF2065 family)